MYFIPIKTFQRFLFLRELSMLLLENKDSDIILALINFCVKVNRIY